MNSTRRRSGRLMAVVLCVPLAGIADDEDRWYDDRRDDHGRWEQRVDTQHVRHGDRYWRRHGKRGGRDGVWWHYPQTHIWHPGWQQHWNSAWHPRWGRIPRGHWQRWDHRGFVAGALIGSTATRSELHRRGDHHRCDHDRRQNVGSARCYRVERLPDGRERRVPLPDAACF